MSVEGFTHENCTFQLDSMKEILENWCHHEHGGIPSAEQWKREPQQVIDVVQGDGPILCIFSE